MSKALVVIDEDRLNEMLINAAVKGAEIAIVRYFTDSPYNSLAEQKVKYLTREEAAKELRITPTTLSKWVREGIIKDWGRGRKMLFKPNEIQKLK